MNKRNLVEDLAICEAATPGPWRYNGNEVVATSKPLVGIAGAMSEEDCEFIAAARQGWPEAIRRAIAAEEEVERLKEAIGLMHDHHGVLTDQVVDEVKKHAKSCVEHELSIRALKDKLQDALKVMQEAVNDIDCEYPQTALIALEAAIQRIQEKRGQSDKNQPKTISVACPECGELNSFNVRRGLGERESDWIKCSFCNVRSGIVRWLRNESVQEGKQS